MSTTLTLPDELAETYAEIARRDGRTVDDVVRTALEIYAERAAQRLAPADINGHEAPRPAAELPADDGRPWAERRAEYYASLGVDASALPDWIGMVEFGPDDGYDSSNIRDWIRANWKPE